MNYKETLIWLSSINGITDKVICNIENHFGDISVIWQESNKEIFNIKGIQEKIKQNIIKYKDTKYLERLINAIETNNIKVLSIDDNDYPLRLKNMYSPPKILYVKGEFNFNNNIAIAIVGSRKATPYGRWLSEKFSRELSQLGITIISGMANGIDTYAHRAALNTKGSTISVLGCGVDIIYPKANEKLYHDIITNGAVISQFPLGTKPFPYNFPNRNRIISALSLGVLIIEAEEKSGSLITAEHALNQGVEIFSIPGNINSVYSKGTNKLIKDGAKLVTSIDDIIEEINEFKKLKRIEENEINYNNLSCNEKKIIECLSNGPTHCDIISYNTEINISEINSFLTILQMKGLVKEMHGKVFVLKK